MTGHQLLLAVLVISSSLFNEYVTAWRACVVPNRNKSPGTNLNADSTALLDCNELDRNGIFKAMSEYDILLVKGEVSPKDLSPLTVEPLQKGMFLVKAPAQSPSVFKRNRRSVPHNSARHAELKDLDQNTFVVSTFAFNPKLLRNGTHAERYSVFAKLTEGVLQEHYKKYGAPDTAHWRDINNQIYTEDLFNNILAATGMFYDSESQSSPGVSKLMQGKTFGQIVNEFQSRMIEEDARGMPLSRKGPQLDLWPKKALHDER